MMPDEANKKLWELLRTLGDSLERDGAFEPAMLKAFAGRERMSPALAAIMSVALRLPVTQFYFGQQLKKNDAWDRRFDAPYGPAAGR